MRAIWGMSFRVISIITACLALACQALSQCGPPVHYTGDKEVQDAGTGPPVKAIRSRTPIPPTATRQRKFDGAHHRYMLMHILRVPVSLSYVL